MKLILGADPLLMPLTGIGHYTKNLAKAIVKRKAVESVDFYAHGHFFDPDALLNPETLSTTKELDNPPPPKKSVLQKIREEAAKIEVIVKVYGLISVYLDRLRLNSKASPRTLFHSPNFTLPAFKGKCVVTIHDLSTVRFPQYHPSARVAYINSQIKKSVKYAAHIVTDSEFIKAELIERYNLSHDFVTAIHLGVDENYKRRDEQEVIDTLNEHGLHYKQYFLFVSTIEPRKNIVSILDAYEAYYENTASPQPLVLVGGNGWHNEDIMQRINLLKGKGVMYLGYVSQTQIPELFSGAQSLVFPSIYEGFGLPVIEAQASGVPVLTSKNSSMSEVVDKYDVEVDPLDVEDIYRGLQKISRITIPDTYSYKRRTWEDVADDYLSLYKRVLNKPSTINQ
ncbi:hypothetical protein BK026_12100 [Alteromonas sp. V450]|uniref:glycosyltransferase family 4 protein n=1 Tax=Alteromonas sp. V450 TaxID=1912139 RepID=UPI0008FF09A7|nr:glycosyltransferase family 1 protein [Alteromonas sp. V450]OJF69468.1 hypothetical protein BK026_12100 [Alteromonas sp. V450]